MNELERVIIDFAHSWHVLDNSARDVLLEVASSLSAFIQMSGEVVQLYELEEIQEALDETTAELIECRVEIRDLKDIVKELLDERSRV